MKTHLVRWSVGTVALALLLSMAPTYSQAAGVSVLNARLVGLTSTTATVQATVNGVSTQYSFKVNSKTVYKEKTGSLLPTKYITTTDTVSVWASALTNGTATKIVDYSTWRTSTTGRITDLDDGRYTFTQKVPYKIANLGVTSYYNISVEADPAISIFRQYEVKKVGKTTIRTNKVRSFANLVDDGSVTVYGYWHKALNTMTATRVQLPDLKITTQ